ARRHFVSRESETARRHDRLRWFPKFGPGAEWLQAAGDRHLLRFVLAFTRRKSRADIDFESRQRFHGERRAFVIADFFERDYVGVELGEIGMHGATLAVFFGTRCVRPATREPLHVPESDGDLR